VEVLETEEGVFFQKDWPKIVSQYSLQVGDFLVFKYNGHHVFDFLILGNTGCEKEQIGASLGNRHEMQEDNDLQTEENEEEEGVEADEMRNREKAGRSRSRRLQGRGGNCKNCVYPLRLVPSFNVLRSINSHLFVSLVMTQIQWLDMMLRNFQKA